MDGVKVEYNGYSLTWVSEHSHMLISLIEQDWKYEDLIPFLTEEWKQDSYKDLLILEKVAPPEVVRDMKLLVEVYIIERILDFRRAMVRQ